jgi:carboxyl-terminal processing protease
LILFDVGLVDAQETIKAGIDLESPLVILVDEKTASAAEVMTAALKENGRATVVGADSKNTFGKGIVQTVKPLSNNNGGVAVTVARYETPKHNDINKQGIPVDLTIPECTSSDAASCVPASAFGKP